MITLVIDRITIYNVIDVLKVNKVGLFNQCEIAMEVNHMKKKALLSLIICLCVILNVSTPSVVATPNASGVIEGLVIDDSVGGIPMPGIRVVAIPTSGSGGVAAITNSNGRYQMPNVALGAYRVKLDEIRVVSKSTPIETTHQVQANVTIRQDFRILERRVYSLSGTVQRTNGTPEPNALIGPVLKLPNGSKRFDNVFSVSATGTYSIPLIAGLPYEMAVVNALVRLNIQNNEGPFIQINGLSTSSTKNIVTQPPPVVMVGGWTGLDAPKNCLQSYSIPSDSLTLAFTYRPGVCPNDYWGIIDDELRDAGYFVQTVSLASTISRTESLATQAQIVRSNLRAAATATGLNEVIIVADNIGSLAVRRAIEFGYIPTSPTDTTPHVLHFFMIGAPHTGINIDSIASELGAEIVRRNGPFDLSRALNNGATNELCRTQAGLCDASIASMGSFNQTFIPFEIAPITHQHTDYHLINGNGTKASFTALGNKLRSLIPPTVSSGPSNDGLTDILSVDFFNTLALDRMVTTDAHNGYLASRRMYTDTLNFSISPASQAYLDCIRKVIIRSNAAACGTVGISSEIPRMNTSAALRTEDELWSNTSITNQHGPIQNGQLRAGQQAALPIVLVDDKQAATFVADWLSGVATVRLKTPDGTLIDDAYAANHTDTVSYTAESNTVIIGLPNAPKGQYELQITAHAANGNPLSYRAYAAFDSAYVLKAGRNKNWFAPNATAVLSATFTGENMTDPTVTAFVQRSDGITDTVKLAAQGQGRYTANYTVPATAGYANVIMLGTANTLNGPVLREQSTHFTIYPESFKLANGASLQLPTNISYYDALTISVKVASVVSGTARITGILSGPNGVEVARATALQPLTVGQELNVPLRFEGEAIARSNRNGPYTLSRVIVVDERNSTLVSADESRVFTTPPFSYRQFAPPILHLPVIVNLLDETPIQSR